MKPEEHTNRARAEAICKTVSKHAREKLQKITDCKLSGEDSPLQNIWEEICVQVQGEQSIFWSAYESTVMQVLNQYVKHLTPEEAEAIWLETDAGLDFDPEQKLGQPPVARSEIVDHIMRDYLFADATEWTSPTIRAFLNREVD